MLEPPNDRPRDRTHLDDSVRVLERGLSLTLGLLAVAILAGAVFLMLKMDGGSRSQGGRFYVAIAALVALGAVDSQFGRLVRRRRPFSLTETAEERRYRMISLLVLLVSAVVLIGLAWLLPSGYRGRTLNQASGATGCRAALPNNCPHPTVNSVDYMRETSGLLYCPRGG